MYLGSISRFSMLEGQGWWHRKIVHGLLQRVAVATTTNPSIHARHTLGIRFPPDLCKPCMQRVLWLVWIIDNCKSCYVQLSYIYPPPIASIEYLKIMSDIDDSPIYSPAVSRWWSFSLTSLLPLPSSHILPDGIEDVDASHDRASQDHANESDESDDGSVSFPPEGYFSSFEVLERYALLHARHHGYPISGFRSKKQYKSHRRKLIMGCVCAQKFRDGLKGQPRGRQKSTIKTGCPFSFLTIEEVDGWMLKHWETARSARHNHGPFENSSILSTSPASWRRFKTSNSSHSCWTYSQKRSFQHCPQH